MGLQVQSQRGPIPLKPSNIGCDTSHQPAGPCENDQPGRILSIASGGYHTLLLDDKGEVWSVGWNALGQLGDGSAETRNWPVKVPGVTNAESISGGWLQSFVVSRPLPQGPLTP